MLISKKLWILIEFQNVFDILEMTIFDENR